MTSRTWLLHLGEEECADLLARTSLGRLGVVVDGRPEIFPVNHVYDAATATVAFPTNERTKVHGALNWPFVAFEVDGLEPEDDSGWSVLVVGHAEEITDTGEIERLSEQRKVLWHPLETVRWLRIVPTKVTGRRIQAVPG